MYIDYVNRMMILIIDFGKGSGVIFCVADFIWYMFVFMG